MTKISVGTMYNVYSLQLKTSQIMNCDLEQCNIVFRWISNKQEKS